MATAELASASKAKSKKGPKIMMEIPSTKKSRADQTEEIAIAILPHVLNLCKSDTIKKGHTFEKMIAKKSFDLASAMINQSEILRESGNPDREKATSQPKSNADPQKIDAQGLEASLWGGTPDSRYMVDFLQPYYDQCGAVHLSGNAENEHAEPSLTQSMRDVCQERFEQHLEFGDSHDDCATNGQLAMAAAVYAVNATSSDRQRIARADPNIKKVDGWPWDLEWWKPSSRRRDLVKSGALILAEIDRIDRIAEGKNAK